MSAKVILVLCAQALLAQVALSQCGYSGGQYLQTLPAPSIGAPCGALGGSGLAYGAGYGIGSGRGIGYGCAGSGLGVASIEVAPTSGGALPVSSASTIAPSGLSVESENVFEGSLLVAGELPFLSAVSLEGVLPSAGTGIVSHSCGNGVTAITNNGLGAAGIGYGAGYGGAYGAGYGGAYGAGYGGAYGAGYGGAYGAGYGSGIAAISPAAGLGLVGGRGCDCGLY